MQWYITFFMPHFSEAIFFFTAQVCHSDISFDLFEVASAMAVATHLSWLSSTTTFPNLDFVITVNDNTEGNS